MDYGLFLLDTIDSKSQMSTLPWQDLQKMGWDFIRYDEKNRRNIYRTPRRKGKRRIIGQKRDLGKEDRKYASTLFPGSYNKEKKIRLKSTSTDKVPENPEMTDYEDEDEDKDEDEELFSRNHGGGGNHSGDDGLG